MQNLRDCSWVQINEGDTALFWSDNWNLGSEVSSLQTRFPRLFSYAKDPWILVKEIFSTRTCTSIFIFLFLLKLLMIWAWSKIWWALTTENLALMMCGCGRAHPSSTGPRCFTLTVLFLKHSIPWIVGFGSLLAPSRLRCFLRCSLWTDWTQRIWWKGGTGTWRMEFTVGYVLCGQEKPGTTCSLAATLVLEFGIICRLIGLRVTPCLIWLFGQGEVLISLSSLKWCSLPAGISGSSKMPKFLEVRGQVLINGEVLLGMILVSCSTESNLLTGMISWSGSLFFPLKAFW